MACRHDSSEESTIRVHSTGGIGKTFHYAVCNECECHTELVLTREEAMARAIIGWWVVNDSHSEKEEASYNV